MSTLFSWLSIPRMIGIWIDSIAFSLIDNVYDLIVFFASNEIFTSDMYNDVKTNTYVIISIFALFRIALLLINSLINPDKLFDSGAGLGKIAQNVVIMFVLLIVTPSIFGFLRDIQKTIVDGNYIGKIFSSGITDFGENASTDGYSPGDMMKKIAVGALIYPDKRLDTGGICESACTGNCKKAIDDYKEMMEGNNGNNKVDFGLLSTYVTVSVDCGDEEVYAYHYFFIVTLGVGVFITYILLSFAIDIALRTVELAVLEILSPIFIASYVDPKSAKSGAFKNWLETVGKTYASLFIKLAIISIMLYLVYLLSTEEVIDKLLNGGFFATLFMLIAVLIFAKKAPKWIMGLIGMKGEEGLGGLSIGKKLGGAMFIGGAASAGINAAKKFGTQKAKNFAGNRARNTLARVGGMKEAMAENHKNKKLANGGDYKKRSLWQESRDAAKRSKDAHYGQNISGMKDITAGYLAGRQNVNINAQTLTDRLKDRYDDRVKAYEEKVGLTEDVRAKEIKMKKDNDAAKKLFAKLDITGDGNRREIKLLNGKNAFLNPQGRKEMNLAFGNPLTEAAAYTALGLNYANAKGMKVGQLRDSNGNIMGDDLQSYGISAMTTAGYQLNSYGNVVDKNGQIIANSLIEYSNNRAQAAGLTVVDSMVRDANNNVIASDLQTYGKQNLTYSGTLAVEHLVAENKQSNVERYQNSVQKYSAAVSEYSSAVGKYNEAKESAINEFKTTDEYKNTEEMSDKLKTAQAELEKAKKQYPAGDLHLLAAERAVKEAEIKFTDAKTISDAKFDVFQKSYLGAFEQSMNDAADAVKTWSIEKAAATSLVKDYKVELNGEKLSPIDNFARISEINSAISAEVSKKKKKFDESLETSSSDKK